MADHPIQAVSRGARLNQAFGLRQIGAIELDNFVNDVSATPKHFDFASFTLGSFYG